MYIPNPGHMFGINRFFFHVFKAHEWRRKHAAKQIKTSTSNQMEHQFGLFLSLPKDTTEAIC